MTSAIVMAAGKGTRMHSDLAKTMHKLMDKPMLEYIYDTLKQVDVDDVVFVVGHGKDDIENYFKDRVTYALQQPQLGTAHAVMCGSAIKENSGKTLIINGDCPLIQKETYQKLLEQADKYPLVMLTTVLEDGGSYGRIVRNEKGSVVKIVEKKDATEEQLKIREVNVGIYCVDNKLLWQMLPLISNNNAQHEYYVTDLIGLFNEHGYEVGAVIGEDAEEMNGINDRRALCSAGKWLQRKINNYWMDNGVTIVDPDTTYIGCDVKIGMDTIIYPNVRIEGKTVIGKNNEIEEGCYFNNACIGDGNKIKSTRITDSSIGNNITLGPNAHLRNNCQISDNCRIGNYVEMKNAKIGEGTKCAHLTYVGDAVVGSHVNFGCGVVTVNYDGKHKYQTIIGDNAFIGSNVNIIAPVVIGDNTVLAAGSTVTSDVENGDLAIARSRQVNKPGYGLKYINK